MSNYQGAVLDWIPCYSLILLVTQYNWSMPIINTQGYCWLKKCHNKRSYYNRNAEKLFVWLSQACPLILIYIVYICVYGGNELSILSLNHLYKRKNLLIFSFYFYSTHSLQTLNSISAEKNSTIIFPLPIDFITHFLKPSKDDTKDDWWDESKAQHIKHRKRNKEEGMDYEAYSNQGEK